MATTLPIFQFKFKFSANEDIVPIQIHMYAAYLDSTHKILEIVQNLGHITKLSASDEMYQSISHN
jgi:hypothetical protein